MGRDHKFEQIYICNETYDDCAGYVFIRKGVCWGSDIFSVNH